MAFRESLWLRGGTTEGTCQDCRKHVHHMFILAITPSWQRRQTSAGWFASGLSWSDGIAAGGLLGDIELFVAVAIQCEFSYTKRCIGIGAVGVQRKATAR
ncbi:unnamed protein product [Symbiodinium necroappetens]|uniref:Uncharacterized protein n=1 Tax=Symbiodinium necroappetens TaxID=1628268 RepID=A0A812N1G9_9DINO|nr:unnamed protein product [Symbiodinium necroappetens]